MIYCEINLTGPNRDLHSGKFGGTIANAICQMLDAMIDREGRIQVPGFYDEVRELSDNEKRKLVELDFSESQYRADLGVSELTGEAGYSTLERRWCRPTFDVNGLWSGYQGDGAKTVLPYQAGAKFSFRLVADQNPQKIKLAIETWLENHLPAGIAMKFTASEGSPGFVLPMESPFMKAASRAIESGFGAKPVFIRSGGSIPVVESLRVMPGVDTLLLGWGQDDDNLHSPNEKFSLEDFHLGIKTSCLLLEELAK